MASTDDSDGPQDSSSSDEESFQVICLDKHNCYFNLLQLIIFLVQVGKIKQFCEGTYKNILPEVGSRQPLGSNTDDVKFFIVVTLECGEDHKERQVHSMIPTGWLSTNMEHLLYPQPKFTVGGKVPAEWGDKTFRRFQTPFDSWMDDDVYFK